MPFKGFSDVVTQSALNTFLKREMTSVVEFSIFENLNDRPVPPPSPFSACHSLPIHRSFCILRSAMHKRYFLLFQDSSVYWHSVFVLQPFFRADMLSAGGTISANLTTRHPRQSTSFGCTAGTRYLEYLNFTGRGLSLHKNMLCPG